WPMIDRYEPHLNAEDREPKTTTTGAARSQPSSHRSAYRPTRPETGETESVQRLAFDPDLLVKLLWWFQPLQRTLEAKRQSRSTRQALTQMALALLWAGLCHTIFAAAVLSMITAMWFGMTIGFGTVPAPLSWLVNLLLLLQFPLVHSILLTASGRRILGKLAPLGAGSTLATTTYAIIASLQLLSLFLLWTPSGIVWWQAEGWALGFVAVLYTCSWLLLMKASWDAGAEVQSGMLGWASLFRGVKPKFPPMPTGGLFRVVRQPIYVSFALTTWFVSVWTPDQLMVATILTAYCLIGPLAKEKRFTAMFGGKWLDYKKDKPYWFPNLVKRAVQK
ncbi:MAG: hypothetical protein AAGG72_07600, partial [Pseudomonadota bacterium]